MVYKDEERLYCPCQEASSLKGLPVATPQNKATASIRDKVGRKINAYNGLGFTLAQLRRELADFLADFKGVDVDKAVSNELLRRVDLGLLSYTILPRQGEPGRPPRLYKQKWVC